jgi:hypothetical protein
MRTIVTALAAVVFCISQQAMADDIIFIECKIREIRSNEEEIFNYKIDIKNRIWSDYDQSMSIYHGNICIDQQTGVNACLFDNERLFYFHNHNNNGNFENKSIHIFRKTGIYESVLSIKKGDKYVLFNFYNGQCDLSYDKEIQKNRF